MGISLCSVSLGLAFFRAESVQVNAETFNNNKIENKNYSEKKTINVNNIDHPNKDYQIEGKENNEPYKESENIAKGQYVQKDKVKAPLGKSSESVYKAESQEKNTIDTKVTEFNISEKKMPVKDSSQLFKTSLLKQEKRGWTKQDDKLFYYKNDGTVYRNQWANPDGKKQFYFGLDGHALVDEWYEKEDGKDYYFDKNGQLLTNQWNVLTKVGVPHYFGKEGYWVHKQWYQINGENYYFNEDGSLIKNQWAQPTGTPHYFGKDGYWIRNRLYQIGNHTYGFDENGQLLTDQWAVLAGKKHHFSKEGYIDENIKPIKKDNYFDVNDSDVLSGHVKYERDFDNNTFVTLHIVGADRPNNEDLDDGYDYDEGAMPIDGDFKYNLTKWSGQTILISGMIDDTVIIPKRELYVPLLKITNLKVDKNDIVTGYVNGNAELEVADNADVGSYEVGCTSLTDGNFRFDASKFSGKAITVKIGSDGLVSKKITIPSLPNDRPIASDVFAKNNDLQIKVDGNDILTGHSDSAGYLTVKDANDPNDDGESIFRTYNSDGTKADFKEDIDEYSGKEVLVETYDEWGNSITSTKVKVPKLISNNIQVDEHDILTGHINGDARVYVETEANNGKKKLKLIYSNLSSLSFDGNSYIEDNDRTFSYDVTGNFYFDASKYSGQNIRLVFKSIKSSDDDKGEKSYNDVINTTDSIYIPKLKVSDIKFDDGITLSGFVNGTAHVYIMPIDNDKTTEFYTKNDGVYSGRTYSNGNGKFYIDLADWSGRKVVLVVTGANSNKAIFEKELLIPSVNLSNVREENNRIKGRINNRVSLYVRTEDGEEHHLAYIWGGKFTSPDLIYDEKGNFSLDASKYKGQNITVFIRNYADDEKIIASQNIHVY